MDGKDQASVDVSWERCANADVLGLQNGKQADPVDLGQANSKITSEAAAKSS